MNSRLKVIVAAMLGTSAAGAPPGQTSAIVKQVLVSHRPELAACAAKASAEDPKFAPDHYTLELTISPDGLVAADSLAPTPRAGLKWPDCFHALLKKVQFGSSPEEVKVRVMLHFLLEDDPLHGPPKKLNAAHPATP